MSSTPLGIVPPLGYLLNDAPGGVRRARRSAVSMAGVELGEGAGALPSFQLALGTPRPGAPASGGGG